ncbi:hypothetical protein HYX02_02510 [Candidatus Woesearchaeota archaeon]|nr:hypothetical protein [Candidatus Woesearchaeota archaeon]
MRHLIKKSILLGLGVASLTKERIDKLVAEFVRRKVITTKDGKWVARKVLGEIAKNKKRLEKLAKLQAEVLEISAKSIERRLVKRGKKTAKKILRMAAKELR